MELGENVIKNVFFMWNCTAHKKSIGHSLNVLPLYRKIKKRVFVFSSLIYIYIKKKKKGVLTFQTHQH